MVESWKSSVAETVHVDVFVCEVSKHTEENILKSKYNCM